MVVDVFSFAAGCVLVVGECVMRSIGTVSGIALLSIVTVFGWTLVMQIGLVVRDWILFYTFSAVVSAVIPNVAQSGALLRGHSCVL